MSWINELTNYYSRIGKDGSLILSVTQSRVTALYREYQYNDDDVLMQAANAYMRENDYFPTILGFKEYLRMAKYNRPKPSPLQEVRAMTLAQTIAADDKRMATEAGLQNGDGLDFSAYGMRPLPEIEAEIDAARVDLREMTS